MNTTRRRRDGDVDGYVDGYVDHHVHFLSSAAASISVDVSGARSVPEVVERLAGTCSTGWGRSAPGGWIRAWGYDEALLDEGCNPTRDDLDRVGTGGRPMVVHHRSGHVVVLNSAALRELGVEDHPDGVLFDRHDLLGRVPRLDQATLEAAASSLSRRWAAMGIDGFVDATHTNGPGELDLMAGWSRDGVVVQRVQMMVGSAHVQEVPPFGATVYGAPSAVADRGRGAVSVGHVKLMPLPGGADEIESEVAKAHDAGFPVAVHVVDIETLQVTLDAFSKSAPPPGSADRIEHNALCLPEQVDAIARSGARVVVNPSFLRARRAKYERELTQVELGWLIRIRSLLDAGVDVQAGSDSPVSEANPAEMIRCAMAHPFVPGESVDLPTATRLLGW